MRLRMFMAEMSESLDELPYADGALFHRLTWPAECIDLPYLDILLSLEVMLLFVTVSSDCSFGLLFHIRKAGLSLCSIFSGEFICEAWWPTLVYVCSAYFF